MRKYSKKITDEKIIDKKTTDEKIIDKKTTDEKIIDKKVKNKSVELVCYCIINEEKKRTYVGATKDFTRRKRQHNREIVGGAKSTEGYKWEEMIIIKGFNSWRETLSFEWHFKHEKTRIKGGIPRRVEALNKLLKKEQWNNLSIYLRDYLYEKIEYKNKNFL